MASVQGLKKNVIKAMIDGTEFIRVTNLSPTDELINVVMYIKVNDDYKVILPNELPHQIVNKLAVDNAYTKMNKEEILDFLNATKGVTDKIISENNFSQLEHLVIDNTIDINYIVTKESGMNYYAISSLIVNEFGVIKDNVPVTPVELPYVIIDILKNDTDFKSKTFLVYQNFFAHVYNDGDKLLTAIFEFMPNKEDEQNPIIQVRGLFTLIEIEGAYTVVFDTENKLFMELNDDKFNNVLESFLDVLELKKLD